jgi:hypothetical protein
MGRNKLKFAIFFGVVLYGFWLLCMYREFGQIDILSELIVPIVIGVPIVAFFSN